MSTNRFISKTVGFEVKAVRYRHQRGVYEVFATTTDQGSWLKTTAVWLYLEVYDMDCKASAQQWRLTPPEMVRNIHKSIREENTRSNGYQRR